VATLQASQETIEQGKALPAAAVVCGLTRTSAPSFFILRFVSNALRRRAIAVTKDLVDEFPQIEGVCLFGSAARGDAVPTSDVDLLVVGEGPQVRPSSIRRRLHLDNADPRVSVVCHTPDTLRRSVETGSRFLVHLQLEGEVLYDTSGLLSELQRLPPLTVPIRAEVEGQLKRLALYEHLERYNGTFLFPLSHIYAIGKAIVMAILTENEIFEFNRDRALDAFTARFPDATEDVETLRTLSAFYRLASRGTQEELPFSYHDCDAEVANAIAAIKRLASHAGHA
jgi:predicted nucleotidyltransferase